MNKNFYAETNDDDKKDLKKLINMEKVIFKEAGVEQVGYVPNEKLLSKYDACNLIPWEVFAEENNLDPKKPTISKLMVFFLWTKTSTRKETLKF